MAVENAHIGFKPKEQPTVRPIHTLDSYKYPMNYFDGIKRRIFFFLLRVCAIFFADFIVIDAFLVGVVVYSTVDRMRVIHQPNTSQYVGEFVYFFPFLL